MKWYFSAFNPMRLLYHIGRYVLWMKRIFAKPEKWSMYRIQISRELEKVGYASVGIVALVSTFMGAVLTLQTAYNITSPFIPKYTVGLAVRDSIILEFAPTIICIILAGKVGSSIAGEIGTMRITDQIDALDIMGINSTGYLVGPKVLAAVISVPFLVMMSMFLGITGGWLAGTLTGEVPSQQFIYGIQYYFQPFYVTYALFKSCFFAVIITSVPAYFGYHVSGGALEVGKASTVSVVFSIVILLMVNLLITQMLLS